MNFFSYQRKQATPVFVLLLMVVILACSCNPGLPGNTPEKNDAVEVNVPESPSYQVVGVFPHDTGAYTQGLIWHEGYFLEGTGQYGESNIRKVDPVTGKVIKQTPNTKDIFGEGITFLNGKIYQITWQNRKGFIYDAVTLKQVGSFGLNTEGWGLTTNGKELIYSDGSSNLYFLDTATFREIKRIGVTDNFGPVSNLNELEWKNGHVLANRYQTDLIYEINPESGQVLSRADFSGLKQQAGFTVADPNNEVLNGIAYDSVKNRLFITGKYWPKLFEVKIGN